MRAFIGLQKANACLSALVFAALEGTRREPWIVEALVNEWVDGQRSFLILLAAFDDKVSEKVLPRAERYTFDSLIAASARETRAFGALADNR